MGHSGCDEVGVAGVTVTLTDGAGNPVIDLWVTRRRRPRDTAHEFTNLMPNVDRIVANAGEEDYEVIPAGYPRPRPTRGFRW